MAPLGMPLCSPLGKLLNLCFALASLEEDFITWREQFWPAVCEHFGVEATGEESRWVWEPVLLGARERGHLWLVAVLSALSCCPFSCALLPLPDFRGVCGVEQ